MAIVDEGHAELGDIIDLHQLTARERKQLAKGAESTPWEYGDRLFGDWASGDVFDYGDPNARAIRAMLDFDGTSRQLEQVLANPVRSADWTLKGGSDRGRKLVAEQVPEPQMELLIAQQTSAFGMRKAFFELSWSLQGAGVHLDGIGFRPATSCQAAFDPKGRPIGFRQRVADPGGMASTDAWRRLSSGEMPGWVRIPKQRSYVYTHGVHREPLQGISDLSVAWWAYETRKKNLFLWMQYLENQSLPKVLAYGKDKGQAGRNAKAIAQLRASGVAGYERSGEDPASKTFDIIESSGKGAEQFLVAARYLEQHMVDSVLAGFTQLAGAASSGTGSYALSADQSEFFLASRQGVADEIALQTSTGLFAPICIYNGLDVADIPSLSIGPISNKATAQALTLLQTMVVAPQLNAPDDFVDALLVVVAPMLQIDPEKLQTAIDAHRVEQKRKADEAEAQQRAQFGMMAAQGVNGAAAGGPRTSGAAELANAINAVHDVYQLARATGDPDEAVELVISGARVGTPHSLDQAAQRAMTRRIVIDLAQARTTPKDDAQTGGMVCLVPDAASARKLAVPGGDPVEQLHLTLAYLGDDVTGWDEATRADVVVATRAVAEQLPGPIAARAFGHTTFNPDGGPDGDRKPCAVYSIGDSDQLVPLHDSVVNLLEATWIELPAQHEPFLPHVTGGYGKTAADLTYTGPVRFDRVAVALGDTWHFIPLGTESTDA